MSMYRLDHQSSVSVAVVEWKGGCVTCCKYFRCYSFRLGIAKAAQLYIVFCFILIIYYILIFIYVKCNFISSNIDAVLETFQSLILYYGNNEKLDHHQYNFMKWKRINPNCLIKALLQSKKLVYFVSLNLVLSCLLLIFFLV